MHPIGLAFLIAGGAFSVAGAFYNWDWFMSSGKARMIIGLFGRQGARIFYALLGLALVVVGILFAFGILT